MALFTETVGEWYEDRAPRLGAALAYYMVFALAPGLIFIISVAALVLGEEQARSQIIAEVRTSSAPILMWRMYAATDRVATAWQRSSHRARHRA